MPHSKGRHRQGRSVEQDVLGAGSVVVDGGHGGAGRVVDVQTCDTYAERVLVS
jgi:hypothetical protein